MPEPQPGEALVKVEAFSVNRGEIFQLEHPHPGTRPGKDIAGLVVQHLYSVGPGEYARSEPTIDSYEYLLVATRPN